MTFLTTPGYIRFPTKKTLHMENLIRLKPMKMYNINKKLRHNLMYRSFLYIIKYDRVLSNNTSVNILQHVIN
jgi:hypothetical protein